MREAEELNQLRSKINSLGVDLLGLAPDDTMLLEPGTILKTSSGKIRRSALKELYEKNKGRDSYKRWKSGEDMYHWWIYGEFEEEDEMPLFT